MDVNAAQAELDAAAAAYDAIVTGNARRGNTHPNSAAAQERVRAARAARDTAVRERMAERRP